MEEIGQQSYWMLYGPTALHSRHPLGYLLLGSSLANLAASPIELEYRAYWAIKSSISLLSKPRNKDFYNFKSSKNYIMSRTKMSRFIKLRTRIFMKNTLIEKLFMFMTRYGFIILVLNSFQGSCALGGMVHMRSLKCLTMDRS